MSEIGSSKTLTELADERSGKPREWLQGLPSAGPGALTVVVAPDSFKGTATAADVAEAMAAGALAHAPVDLAVSITGIAGPGGAVAGKPVGLVHLAAASHSGRLIRQERTYGDIGRTQVRRAAVVDALAMLRDLAETEQARSSGTAHD